MIQLKFKPLLNKSVFSFSRDLSPLKGIRDDRGEKFKRCRSGKIRDDREGSIGETKTK